MPLPLRTARLVLRSLVPTDAEALFAYRADPLVSAMQGWTPLSRAEAAAFVSTVADVPFARRGGWSQVGIVDARSDRLIGDIGVHFDAAGEVAEIGYSIARAFQRRGYATEAVTAVLEELVMVHRIPRFVARADPRNKASIALLRRLGFAEDGRDGAHLRFMR